MAKNDWEDSQIQLLKELWGFGLSAQKISERLGNKSRNAVIGKANRLNLSSRAVGVRARPEKPKPAPVKTKIVINIPSPEKPKKPRKVYIRKNDEQIKEIARTCYGQKTKLLHLKSNQCHWGVGDPRDDDFGFCAAPIQKGKKNYCEKHDSIKSVQARETNIRKSL